MDEAARAEEEDILDAVCDFLRPILKRVCTQSSWSKLRRQQGSRFDLSTDRVRRLKTYCASVAELFFFDDLFCTETNRGKSSGS